MVASQAPEPEPSPGDESESREARPGLHSGRGLGLVFAGQERKITAVNTPYIEAPETRRYSFRQRASSATTVVDLLRPLTRLTYLDVPSASLLRGCPVPTTQPLGQTSREQPAVCSCATLQVICRSIPGQETPSPARRQLILNSAVLRLFRTSPVNPLRRVFLFVMPAILEA